jgi:hypothetical protein
MKIGNVVKIKNDAIVKSILKEGHKCIFKSALDKDYMPIKFEFMQSEMECAMRNLYVVCSGINPTKLSTEQNLAIGQLQKFKDDIQHKINLHKERGEWV